MPVRWLLCALGILLPALGCLSARGQGEPPVGDVALIEAENNVTVKRGDGPWQKGEPVMPLAVGHMVQTGEFSRATVRLSRASVARMDELTRAEIVNPRNDKGKPSVNLAGGALYFFSREKAQELEVLTPAATGALRGTEFVVRVGNGRTQFMMLDGEVELHNDAGSVVLRNGEMGEAEPGQAPRKTAMIEADNIIQWALYYPAVLYPAELGMGEAGKQAVGGSLAAYEAGDLPGSLEQYPRDYRPATTGDRLYRAGVMLAVGRLDKVERELAQIPADSRGRMALEQMIAAVKLREWKRSGEPQTVSEWMAESYYLQSRGDLEGARTAARRATEKAPGFGYAWVRLAELEFSFGRTARAKEALTHGLALTPRNAQGHALRGFLFSADNDIRKARESFDEAIRLDGALGNAWLGRGLTCIRQGDEEAGLRDLQAAAVLEPNRSIFHSYLGKAFSQTGNGELAGRDLLRAKELDPKDPTPWLYSAIQNKQQNRYNEAIDDLEKSVELNDNRRLYRSRFLLDQDRSIRGTNLAAIYQKNGMTEQSVREATLAVDSDYSSAPAHLFLANSYNALRDPTRVLLRYETPWFNEMLLSNLLSPVGGGPLSQFVSEQEYSKMFQHDGFGVSSVTEYFSNDQLREVGSQYGTFGNFAYAVDAEYYHSNGERPNNEVDRTEIYGTFKLQATPSDGLFFQVKYQSLDTGDVLQRYDQDADNLGRAALTTDFNETQDPGLLLAGYHHEWAPGHHTLLLAGRLANQQDLSARDTLQSILVRDVSGFTAGLPFNPGDFANPFGNPAIYDVLSELVGEGPVQAVGNTPLDLTYDADFVTYTGEVQQIITLGPDTIIAGGRYQSGDFDTSVRMKNHNPGLDSLFDSPAADQDFSVGMNRASAYLYNIFHVTSWLSLTGGVTYDRLEYPENFRNAPVNDRQQKQEAILPKAGFILRPTKGMVIRGAYTQALSGASFDESVRLEPTQVAGFSQAYRSLASESILGSVAGSTYELYGLSIEQKFPTRTYVGVGLFQMEQEIDQTVGTYDFLNSMGGYPNEILPSSLAVNDEYRERGISATVNQLLGEWWSIGSRYSLTNSRFTQHVHEIPSGDGDREITSNLHQVGVFALFNHPCGAYIQPEANWYLQSNEGFADPHSGDNFWQFNFYSGYRFYRNQCEVGGGILNLGDTDYRLEPLTPYAELPRDRTYFVRVKVSF